MHAQDGQDKDIGNDACSNKDRIYCQVDDDSHQAFVAGYGRADPAAGADRETIGTEGELS